MRFRPCIDLHKGFVKQIVGSTLKDEGIEGPATNFKSDRPASYYARLYCEDELKGGHVIKLGPGNDDAAIDALQTYPGGLQLGGGVDSTNAGYWLDAGAERVIVTSYVFSNGQVNHEHLRNIVHAVGREKLVLDLSCRKKDGRYYIVTERWQNFTEVEVSPKTLDFFSKYCSEFLIHAVDVEGKCSGIEEELVENLGCWTMLPTTYAGGIRSMEDISSIQRLGNGKLDFTVGSALDIFGGSSLRYKDLV